MSSLSTSRRAVLMGGAGLAGLAGVALGGPAEAALPRASVAARRKHFGAANVDREGRVRPDRLILSWFGVTNFAMALAGRVVLLDAWVPRGEYSGVVPTDPEELSALAPSHVFLGHAHWDHAADAAAILTASGARLVGTAEHVRQVRKQAGREVPAVTLGSATSPLGPVGRLRIGPIRVTAVRHPHSTVKAPDGEHAPLLPVPDLSPILTHPPTLADGLHELSHLLDAEGGCLLYQFRVRRFRLLWNDTCGPIREDAAAPVRRWLRSQPRTDVQVGAVQGFGQFTNGLRDPIDYVADVRPKVLVPTHHDNWAPPITSPAASYEAPLRKALAALPARSRPALRMITDPRDYVRPGRLTFRI